MKQEWKGACQVLRLGHFGEAHIWLRLLLADRGVSTAFAFGGAKSRHRFCGCLDIFNELSCRLSISGHGEFVVMEEATLEEAPRHLRSQWRHAGMAANCLRFTEALAVGRDGSREAFTLVRDLRQHLEKEAEPSPFLPLFFRLRLAAALGYAPHFGACACGAPLTTGGCFVASEGRVFCRQCMEEKGFAARRHSFWLSPGALALAATCTHTPISQMPLASASQADLRQCGRAINDFVEFQMGLTWENGGFRRV